MERNWETMNRCDEPNRSYPQAYYDYLATYYGLRDYFECHDIMEEYWKEQPNSRYTGCWLVFIRIAVASYHARRGNWAGARKMMAKAAAEADPRLMSELGMDGDKLASLLKDTAERWSEAEPPVYRDLALPIIDPLLEAESRSRCLANGWTWDTPLHQVQEHIVHRHLTRDRAPVVEARKQSAERKRLARDREVHGE